MPTLSDFTNGPGWKIQWTKNPDNNPTYPLNNVLLIVRNASNPETQADLIWMDGDGKRHDLMGVPFDGRQLSGDKCKDLDGGTYDVTVVIASGQIVGIVSPSPPGITPLAGTWGAEANGG